LGGEESVEGSPKGGVYEGGRCAGRIEDGDGDGDEERDRDEKDRDLCCGMEEEGAEEDEDEVEESPGRKRRGWVVARLKGLGHMLPHCRWGR